MSLRILLVLTSYIAFCFTGYNNSWAKTSTCEECHLKITPGIIKDFNRSVMSAEIGCTDCHGTAHNSEDDVEKAQLPTIATCEECHSDQAEQYLSGKHALGLVAA